MNLFEAMLLLSVVAQANYDVDQDKGISVKMHKSDYVTVVVYKQDHNEVSVIDKSGRIVTKLNIEHDDKKQPLHLPLLPRDKRCIKKQ